MESFTLAMAVFPEVQKRAQAELDRVVGPDRLPEYDDLEHLPYIRAISMEVMRWMPMLCFGLPHALTEDDVYNGYHIPKGTMVIPVGGISAVKLTITKTLTCLFRTLGRCCTTRPIIQNQSCSSPNDS